jgi:hypothetical protein
MRETEQYSFKDSSRLVASYGAWQRCGRSTAGQLSTHRKDAFHVN